MDLTYHTQESVCAPKNLFVLAHKTINGTEGLPVKLENYKNVLVKIKSILIYFASLSIIC
jgi:hypothetical protein